MPNADEYPDKVPAPMTPERKAEVIREWRERQAANPLRIRRGSYTVLADSVFPRKNSSK